MRLRFSTFLWNAEVRALFLCLGLLLPGCKSTPAGRVPSLQDDGYVVGNGGDPLRAKIEKGRLGALDAVDWANERRLLRDRAGLTADETWFLDHKKEVKDEIDALAFSWATPAQEETCRPHEGWQGCTLPQRGSPVWILRSGVPQMLARDLEELILHETLHHFLGRDEARVYALASRIYQSWAASLSYRMPMGIQHRSWPDTKERFVVEGGQAVYVWNPCNESVLRVFSPSSGWKSLTLEPALPWIEGYAKNPFHCDRLKESALAYAPSPSRLVAFSEGGFGMAIDLNTGHWTALPSDPMFPPRFSLPRVQLGDFSTTVVRDKRAVVLGWALEGQTPFLRLFNGDTLAWRELPRGPLREGTMFECAGLTETSLLLQNEQEPWSRHRYWAPRGGFRLDLAKQAWFPLPKRNAPDDLHGMTTVTGKAGALLFGGWRNENETRAEEFLPVGAYYDERNDSWIVANAPAGLSLHAPESRRLLGRAEGDFFHLMGESWVVWSPRTGQWEVLESRLGSFLEDTERVFQLDSTFLFWNRSRIDGFLISR